MGSVNIMKIENSCSMQYDFKWEAQDRDGLRANISKTEKLYQEEKKNRKI